MRKTVRTELDEDLLEQFHGTVSLPSASGDNQRVAVKIVDDRDIGAPEDSAAGRLPGMRRQP
jgi:adenine-specific DNA-methyltransferase